MQYSEIKAPLTLDDEPKPLSGKAAVLVFAAGDGSRLKCSNSKALFSLPSLNLTLFELMVSRIDSLRKKTSMELDIVFMINPKYRAEFEKILEKRGWGDKNIHFINQQMLPMLDDRMIPYLENNKPLLCPDGNGSVYQAIDAETLKRWDDSGIKSIFCVAVDNPFSYPFSPKLLEDHLKRNRDVTLIAIENKSAIPMGSILAVGNSIAIVEYLDKASLSFKPKYSNSNNFVLSLDFIKKASLVKLPYTLVEKYYNGKKVYKFERFWFNALYLSAKTEVFLGDFRRYGSPLKNFCDVQAFENMWCKEILCE